MHLDDGGNRFLCNFGRTLRQPKSLLSGFHVSPTVRFLFHLVLLYAVFDKIKLDGCIIAIAYKAVSVFVSVVTHTLRIFT